MTKFTAFFVVPSALIGEEWEGGNANIHMGIFAVLICILVARSSCYKSSLYFLYSIAIVVISVYLQLPPCFFLSCKKMLLVFVSVQSIWLYNTQCRMALLLTTRRDLKLDINIFIFHHSRCVRCECNQHADSCDADTGKCDCLHNTVGDDCSICKDGFYGNPTAGTPDDCKPCPCKYGTKCIEIGGKVTCTVCDEGHQGNNLIFR